MSIRLVRALVLVLGLVLLLAAWFAGNPGPVPGFPLDDAWIHMVYGRQLAADGFLAYNPSAPATGCTSPLWAIVLGGLHLLLGGHDPETLVLATYVLGGALHLATLLSVLQLARATGASLLAASASALCVAAAPLFALSALSGMEVTLCSLLLVLGHERLLRQAWVAAGVVLGLACCTRPEATLCLGSALPLALLSRAEAEAPPALGARARSLARFALGPLLLGGSLIGYNVWASGRPFPATYYFKQATSLAELPARLGIALTRLLAEVAPFTAGWIWLGLLGFILPLCLAWRAPRAELRSLAYPGLVLIAGLTFLVGNVLVIPPHDPAAYYHQRYILPAMPLLIVGLVCGFERLRFGTRLWQQRLPLAASVAASLVFGLGSLPKTSRHFHSDIRNINELQRVLGEWLGHHTSPSAWLATVDAGAVRYFSKRPAIDIMGLNTPELYWQAPAYAASHPVQAIVLMPAWFQEILSSNAHVLREVRSTPYTVTSNPAMGFQVALGCGGRGAGAGKVGLNGARRVLLHCVGADEPGLARH